MDLDDRHLERFERVADCVAVVTPCARIDDYRIDVVVRVVDPPDVLALAVRLAAASADVKGVRPLVDLGLELVEAQPAVELRIATFKRVEIRSVEDQDLHQAMRVSSAARTSSGGRAATKGPSSPSSTRLISPRSRFLSRSSASQARSRST